MLTARTLPREAKQRVRIDIRGHVASIKLPDAEAILDPVLSVESWIVDIHENQIGRRRETDQLFSRNEQGCLVFPAGLVGRVADQLRRHGFSPVVVDQTLFPKNYASRRVLRSTRYKPEDRQLLAAAASHLGGQLLVRSSASALWIVALLCRLFRHRHVLVVVPNTAAEAETAARLRGWLSRKVGLCTDLDAVWAMRHRLSVIDVQKFGTYGPRSDDFQIVIFLDSQLALGGRALVQLMNMDQTVRFGLTSSVAPTGQSDELMLEAVFGQPVWTQSDLRDDLRRVEVHFATPPSTPGAAIQEPLERKRQTIWHNAARNRAIADIATAFANRDLEALWPHGLLLEAPKTWFRRYPRNHPKVVILVESLEHARELGSLLPDWSIRSADLPWWDRMTNEDVNHRAIVTAVCAHADGVCADVLIRADGTDARWDPKCGPHTQPDAEAPRATIIVDLREDFDETAKTHTRARIREYGNRGWTTSGLPDHSR
jgi:hypothetical protein